MGQSTWLWPVCWMLQMISGSWEVTNLPMHRRWTSTVCASTLREACLHEKSGGYQIHISQLATLEALERLILAIATLHLTSLGLGVVQVGKRSFVDTHWDRGLSYLKIG